MPKSPALKFQQLLAWLMTEVMFGRAHFRITRGVSHADRAVSEAAPRFFGLTRDAHANEAQMCAARIFDRTAAASIYELMSSALNEAGAFKHGTAADVRRVVAEARVSVAVLEPLVRAILTRRHETMAHMAARPIIDPDGYVRAGRISYRELEKLFDQTGLILNKLSLLHRGASVVLELKDANDYEQALDLIVAGIKGSR